MATVIIGDVHGCVDELDSLLRTCGCGPGDDVVLVGDLVAKGPDSKGVLALVRERGLQSVLGNHDAHVLRWKAQSDAGNPLPDVRPAHARLAREFGDEDWAQLRALPLFRRLPEHNALVVHAGIVPGIPVEAQDPNMLLNMRTIRPDGRPSRSDADGVLWGSTYHGPELVLFGHHARAGFQRHAFAIGLDTGCVYGGRLTAYVLPAGEVISVAARRSYAAVHAERG